MLVVDPGKRATMDEIILHPWMQPVFHLLNLSGTSTSPILSSIIIHHNFQSHTSIQQQQQQHQQQQQQIIQQQQELIAAGSNNNYIGNGMNGGNITIDMLDANVIQELMNLGYEKEEILNNVKQNKYNDCAATYFLLCSRKNREAQASSRDIESYDAFYSDQPSIIAPTGDKSPLIKYKRHHRRSQTADNSNRQQQQTQQSQGQQGQQQQQQQKSQHLNIPQQQPAIVLNRSSNVQNNNNANNTISPNESPLQSPGSTSPPMGTSPNTNMTTAPHTSSATVTGDKPPRQPSSDTIRPELKNQITSILSSAPATPINRGNGTRQISRSANASASTSPNNSTPGSPVGSFIKPSIHINNNSNNNTTKQTMQRRATASATLTPPQLGQSLNTSGGHDNHSSHIHHIHNRARSNSSSVADSQPKESKVIDDDWVIFEDYPDQLYTDGTYGGTPRHQYVKQYQTANSANSKKRSSVHNLLSSFKNMLKRSEDKEITPPLTHHQQHAYTTHNTPIISSVENQLTNNNNNNTDDPHYHSSIDPTTISPFITTPISSSEILDINNQNQTDNNNNNPNESTSTTTTDEQNTISSNSQPSTQPRIVRFVFGVHTTSMKPAPELMKQVLSVVSNFCIPHTQKGDYALECESEGVRFTIEVCRVPRLSVNGLKFKRIGGSAWRYKGICKDLLSQMKLTNT
ncbi:putative protein serine/threonine kinase [Cavenderia fasciculata]|uniref:non-specific serine/threonine protein kinase n=1 Tax=Cavenderia fasciculata TaxID=261658 RepID=F4Q1Y1_CACFS|nr:putative protein serine/threonine kinase [Cavenderia fasciculata]EGG18001.1 putative protein serine/threonine kinase [Cavenderia fasciculata]|eukprot:XP_004356894.1 putative protein serine/threonine kinase [Cavenderia fasciculata]